MLKSAGNGKYYVYSHDGKKKLIHRAMTKGEAIAHLRRIEYWKKRKGKA